jgi:transposase
MLNALLEGETDPATLADLAQGRLREKRAALEQALVGTLKAHHRFLLAEYLGHVDYLDEAIERFSVEIGERLRDLEEEIAQLDTIPGVSRRVAEVVLAEVGADMTRFPSVGHLASWAGLCPGNNESAGKRLSGRTRKGSPWLRQALTEAAHGAARSKRTYLAALYHRIARRRGGKKAVIAVAHAILRLVYYLLTRQETYHDLGPAYFDKREQAKVERRLVRRLEQLGHEVILKPKVAA